jgi:HTH-type transcriptional regulator, competence development regulator
MPKKEKNLGHELMKARESRDLSLRDVEKQTKISNAYLSQLEHNKIKNPATFILHKLAKFYEIEFDFLLEVAGILEKKPRIGGPNTLAGSALYSKGVTPEEETQLLKYLKFLRTENK